MTDQPQNPGADDEPELPPDDGAAADQVVDDAPATPRQIKKARRERLSSWGAAMIGTAGELEWIIRGPRDATLRNIKSAVQLLETLYESFDADPTAQTIGIAGSVHITIGPSGDERIKAEMILDELRRLDQGEPAEPPPTAAAVTDKADDDAGVTARSDTGSDTEYEKLLRDSVPNTVLANSLLVDLIEDTLDEEADPLEEALKYGKGVATSYRGFVAGLDAAGLEVEATSKTEERSVRVPPERLEQLKEQLSREGRAETFTTAVAGDLSMADANKLEFRVDFAKDVPRPDVLREWRGGSISGHYTPAMKQSISDRGLWGKEVLARVRVTREARGSSATRRRPDVELIDVRLRFEG